MEQVARSRSLDHEKTIMCVWPSIAKFRAGLVLGQLYHLGPQLSILGIPARLGWLLVLPTLPLAIGLYFLKAVPRLPFVFFGVSNPFCRSYRLTTERVVVEHPFDALSASRQALAVKHSVTLGEFDSIDVERQAGYGWFRAGDLVFKQNGDISLRLSAVAHAESFRATCLKANQSRKGLIEAGKRGQAVATRM